MAEYTSDTDGLGYAVPGIQDIVARVDQNALSASIFAATVVREAIVTGALAGGQAIRQDELARVLCISKVPLREALRELEGQGLVLFRPNRGFVVTLQSRDEMEEMFAIRYVIEPLAVRMSMPMINRIDIQRAERAIDQMRNVKDGSWLCRLNLEMHHALYAPCGMPHLMQMIHHAYHVSHRYIHLAMQLGETPFLDQSEHEEIVSAFVARDVETAVTLIERHVRLNQEHLRGLIGHRLTSASED